MILRTFGWSAALTGVAMLVALAYQGPGALALVAILAVLEISLSFDNAVVNAKVLDRMSPFWQKIFLTVGIAVAVFGMRLLFPLVIVALTAKLSPMRAFDLALSEPHRYETIMRDAYPMIAGFGGAFLLMLFLNWVFEERELRWLGPPERFLARMGRLDQLPVVVTGGVLALVSGLVADDPAEVMIAGVLGMITYILVEGLGALFSDVSDDEEADEAGEAGEAGQEAGAAPARRGGPSSAALAVGKAGFFLFLYLEVLDASFSFDGVIGAFAISTDPIVIALGLGVGAMYIRSLTVYLVRKGTLHEYEYLEHGAHWAIGALSVCMMISIGHELPDWVTGGIGAGLILVSFLSSVVRNRRETAAESVESSPEPAGGEPSEQEIAALEEDEKAVRPGGMP
ncbi:DUF475 domain-containing protein [Actinomadura harenae]|uniref:DUF475 domain-containing protein n=1 Tax=Actinomadura harenae TaxID=2483351 RepID=A0A3M2MC50_9ACTN|nr:DUF475 domain-containing protein [Actinomadura harenae]RMI47071.1 DUF475 domain-containing protein [Actinomadura harenae]